jgi:thiol-disulfide isomerase/thioredoxin
MMRAALTWLCAALLLTGLSVQAASPRPFVDGSLQTILSRHAGKPFVLGFWSLSCSHCREELALLGTLARKFPHMAVVLVSTDTPEDDAAIEATLRDHSLDTPETWVFADPDSDRLRYQIDRHWYGELPRTYLYAADGTYTSVSGRIDERALNQWLRKQPDAESK